MASAAGPEEFAGPIEDDRDFTPLSAVRRAHYHERAAVGVDIVIVVQRWKEGIDQDPARQHLDPGGLVDASGHETWAMAVVDLVAVRCPRRIGALRDQPGSASFGKAGDIDFEHA